MMFLYLASQDAIEVMFVPEWVMVSRLDWCDPGDWGYLYGDEDEDEDEEDEEAPSWWSTNLQLT